MDCFNAVEHVVTYTDTVYMLARYYNTTVEEILNNNRHINPYNLQVGEVILICPNSIYDNTNNNTSISKKHMELADKMNTLWEQHVLWTRLLLISIAENLKDLEPTKKRLLRNPKDIANVYRVYYGEQVANKIDELLTQHLVIGGDLIVALKNGETAKAKELDTKWYRNADDIAQALSSINPYYNKEEVRKMLYDHLALTTEEVAARLRKDYTADIEAFDKVEKEALMMARYFTSGIVKQFPNMF